MAQGGKRKKEEECQVEAQKRPWKRDEGKKNEKDNNKKRRKKKHHREGTRLLHINSLLERDFLKPNSDRKITFDFFFF